MNNYEMSGDLPSALECPGCHQTPQSKLHLDGNIEVFCDKHGFTAQGLTKHMAILHWNKLINFIRGEMGL